MSDYQRSIAVSLAIHAIVLVLVVRYGSLIVERPPVSIDLTITGFPGGSKGVGNAGGGGGGGSPAPLAPQPPAPKSTGNAMALPQQSVRQAAPAPTAPVPVVKASQPSPVPVAHTAPVLKQLPTPSPAAHPTVPAAEPRGEAHPVAAAAPSGSGAGSGTGTGIGSGRGSGTGTGVGSGVGAGRGPGTGPGTGSGNGNGNGNGNGSGNGEGELRKRYLAEHFAYIMRLIQKRIVYPPRAKREGLAGRAKISFVILENGNVTNITVRTSTGYEILDASAVQTIKDTAPFPKPPIKAELMVPITYQLAQ